MDEQKEWHEEVMHACAKDNLKSFFFFWNKKENGCSKKKIKKVKVKKNEFKKKEMKKIKRRDE